MSQLDATVTSLAILALIALGTFAVGSYFRAKRQ